MKLNHTQTPAEKRRIRVRSKVRGTSERPRLHVFRSNKHIALQVIDDEQAKTLVSANDVQKANQKKKGATKTDSAKNIAEKLVEGLQKQKITQLVFDRGSYRYHGRVKAIAETLREKGIQV